MILALACAAGASAISAPIHIAGTGGDGVFIRPTPDTSQPAIGWMAEGTSPDYHCFTYGQMIGNVNVWFYVTHSGVTGYYASYYDDSSYHSEAELTAKYGIPKCGAPAPSPPPPPAPAPAPPPSSPAPAPAPAGGGSGSGPIYTIMNADGGVYFRDSPSWGDTRSIPGVGVYNGDQVQLICGELGEPYGPYANRWWSRVQNLTRPSAGTGWVNAHFINDGMPANTPSPGEGTCGVSGASGGGTGPGAATPAPPKSVFFWPQLKPSDRPTNVPFLHVSDADYDFGQWSQGNCNPTMPSPYRVPDTVNTLAGWSLSRLGPLYFLATNPDRWTQIHTIILFDPGSYAQMAAPGCDEASPARFHYPTIGSLLDRWLQQDGNELLILTGEVTEEPSYEDQYQGRPKLTFAGLWHFYLPDLWRDDNSAVRSRAIVCDYLGTSHPATLQQFYPIVAASGWGRRPDGCPVSDFLPRPTRWSP